MHPIAIVRMRPTIALLLGLALAGAGCGDPTAPGALPGSYRLRNVRDGWGGPIRTLPMELNIVGSAAKIRIYGGALVLRADSTYELRLAASRDSAGTRTPLPSILMAGQYTAVATPQDNAFDYSLRLTIDGRPGDTWTANRDNFYGRIVACCLTVDEARADFLFER